MYSQILDDFKLEDSNVLNVYPYGSRIYRTNTPTSDYDFVVVCKTVVTESDRLDSKDNPISITIYSQESFQNKVNENKISLLECVFCPEEKILKQSAKPNFKLDKAKLRVSISEKCSKDWNQAKKRFSDSQGINPVTGEKYTRKVYEGKKSLFHCFRMIDFGTQIINGGKISNFASCNDLWEEIYTNPSEDWEDYKTLYHDLFNARMTEFRKIAPK
jgi:hypothetical protein